MRQRYDKSSKWLLEHYGDAMLRLGGVRGVRRWHAHQPEVVQPSQLPDGLLEVFFQGQRKPDYFLVEIATYYEKRLQEQVLRDAQLVWMARKALPEVLALVLCRRGRTDIPGSVRVQSRLGWTEASLRWKVVPLWTVPAAQLLAAEEVGLIPWVPLTEFSGPPEPILEQCRRRIEQQAPRDRQANLLAVTAVLAQLRFSELELLALLGGEQAMIESPLLKEIEKRGRMEGLRRAIEKMLAGRFGPVPEELSAKLRSIKSERKLEALASQAGLYADLTAFQAAMRS
jgi:predicted transposase YdaD